TRGRQHRGTVGVRAERRLPGGRQWSAAGRPAAGPDRRRLDLAAGAVAGGGRAVRQFRLVCRQAALRRGRTRTQYACNASLIAISRPAVAITTRSGPAGNRRTTGGPSSPPAKKPS